MVVVGVLIALEGGDVRSRPRPCSFTVSLEITGVTRRVARFSYRVCVCVSRRVGHFELESGRRAAPPARLRKVGVKKYSTVKCGYESLRRAEAMRRNAAQGAAVPPPAFVLPADLVMPPPAGFEQAPKAVQAMWCYARDVDEFREQAGAVIEAYNKATAAGALQSTAERAAAAVAYKINAGYRNFVKDDKKWKLERRVAAAKLEALATKARRLVKKARRRVSCLPAFLHVSLELETAESGRLRILHSLGRPPYARAGCAS